MNIQKLRKIVAVVYGVKPCVLTNKEYRQKDAWIPKVAFNALMMQGGCRYETIKEVMGGLDSNWSVNHRNERHRQLLRSSDDYKLKFEAARLLTIIKLK